MVFTGLSIGIVWGKKGKVKREERRGEVKAKAQSAFKTGMDTGAPQASKVIITQKLDEFNENALKIEIMGKNSRLTKTIK
jgi:hypothetical protein